MNAKNTLLTAAVSLLPIASFAQNSCERFAKQMLNELSQIESRIDTGYQLCNGINIDDTYKYMVSGRYPKNEEEEAQRYRKAFVNCDVLKIRMSMGWVEFGKIRDMYNALDLEDRQDCNTDIENINVKMKDLSPKYLNYRGWYKSKVDFDKD